MDRWKAEVEQKNREEKSRREKIRQEKVKEDPGARKGRKVAKHCGRKVGSLKRRVRSPLARWHMKNCMRLWREAHFQVKMYKTHQLRTTFGNWDVEKVHAIVARSTFRSENVQNTPFSDHFWKLRCWKSARRCGAKHIRSQNVESTRGPDHFWKLRCRKSARRCGTKHISKLKCEKHQGFGSDHFWKLRCRKSARCCRAKHISKLKCEKHQGLGPLLDVQMSFRVAGARDCGPCQKWAKREGFVAFPKTMAGVGHLKRICKDAFSVAGAVQETCSSEVLGGPGADFLREVAFWSIRSTGLLRWFCVTGAALRMTWHHFFVAGAVLQTGGLEKSQNAMVRGRQLCTQLSIFEGSLTELFRFWCCQLRKMRKSRRIATFLTLSSSKIEEVSLSCRVFDVAKLKNWGRLAESLRFQAWI